jgi:tetratricopeptide (TPR) repeat protein
MRRTLGNGQAFACSAAGRSIRRLAAGILILVSFVAAAPQKPGLQERLDALRREAAGRNPPSPHVLSERLTAIGNEFVRDGRFPEAIELFSEALGYDPESGDALSELIIAYLHNGDVEFADFYLEQATAGGVSRSSTPDRYRTIGDLFASLHRLEEAVSAWDSFRRLGGSDPALDARLDRARRELSIRQPQRVRTSDRLLLYTDASISEAVTDRVEEHLEAELETLRRFFASDEQVDTQVVVLYDGRGYFSLVSIPTWVSGVFDGKIRVSLESPARWSAELAGVLSHELAHSYLRAVSRGRAPAWLHEGLGQWFAGERLPRRDLGSWFSRQKVRSIGEMDAFLAHRTDREGARDVYLEALGLTQFLIEERGTGAVRCLVADLGAGIPFEEAVRRQTAWTGEQLVSHWKAAIGSRAVRP